MVHFPVRPEKEKALLIKMVMLGIREQDIVEKFIHGGGKGGQKINKAASAVYLKHLPTGIEVKCQKERSQSLNRFLARRILVEKIEKKIRGEAGAEQQRIEKIRRQKRKRSKRAKLRTLEAKKQQSEKKRSRSFRPGPED
jgi:protein subunit release factor B